MIKIAQHTRITFEAAELITQQIFKIMRKSLYVYFITAKCEDWFHCTDVETPVKPLAY